MRLDQEGRLRLTDKLSNWYPDAPNASEITVRMLVEHVSGLPDLDPNKVGTVSTDELIQQTLAQGAKEPPGSTFRYNNLGYLLLGKIAESATGSTYGELVRQQFLDPLRLTNTYVNGEQAGPAAINGYDVECGGGSAASCIGKPSTLSPVSDSPQWTAAWSAGAVVSNAEDLTRWIRALVAGDVLDEQHRTMMRTMTTQSSTYYADAYKASGTTPLFIGEGTGLQGYRVPGVGDCFGHAGAIPGSNSITAYCPDAALAITVLNNSYPAGDNPGAPGIVQLAPPALAALGS
jgi:CubicO group peptidase (beta-lactamase class C family)